MRGSCGLRPNVCPTSCMTSHRSAIPEEPPLGELRAAPDHASCRQHRVTGIPPWWSGSSRSGRHRARGHRPVRAPEQRVPHADRNRAPSPTRPPLRKKPTVEVPGAAPRAPPPPRPSGRAAAEVRAPGGAADAPALLRRPIGMISCLHVQQTSSRSGMFRSDRPAVTCAGGGGRPSR